MSLASSAGAAYLSSVVTREGTRRHKRWSPGFPTEEQKHWPGDVCGAGPSSWCGRSRKPLIGSWQPALNPEMPLTPWQRYYLHLTGSRGRGGISHGAWDNQKCELGEDGPQTGKGGRTGNGDRGAATPAPTPHRSPRTPVRGRRPARHRHSPRERLDGTRAPSGTRASHPFLKGPQRRGPRLPGAVCPRRLMLLTNPGNGSTGPRAYGQALGTDGRCLGPDRRLRLPQAVVTRHLLSAAFRGSPMTSRSLSRLPAPRQHVPSRPAAVRSPPQHSAQTDGCPSSCVACPPSPPRAHAQSARRAGAGAPSSAAVSECR